eukprot:scaffold164133_cov35-Tisochrysis_lutea.AAC.4
MSNVAPQTLKSGWEIEARGERKESIAASGRTVVSRPCTAGRTDRTRSSSKSPPMPECLRVGLKLRATWHR